VEGPQVVENVHSEDELVALNALELAEMLPLEMLPVDSRAHRTAPKPHAGPHEAPRCKGSLLRWPLSLF
jgi:hypothetical protein